MPSKKICFYFLFVITGILTKSTKDPYDIWLTKFLSFCLHSENTSSTTTECIKSGFWQNLQHDLKEHLLKKKKKIIFWPRSISLPGYLCCSDQDIGTDIRVKKLSHQSCFQCCNYKFKERCYYSRIYLIISILWYEQRTYFKSHVTENLEDLVIYRNIYKQQHRHYNL